MPGAVSRAAWPRLCIVGGEWVCAIAHKKLPYLWDAGLKKSIGRGPPRLQHKSVVVGATILATHRRQQETDSTRTQSETG